jgi:thioesterase domain-containing protein
MVTTAALENNLRHNRQSRPDAVEFVEDDAQAHLARVVRAVWERTLPSTLFDPGVTWRDVGLDSLKALEFAMRLEQSLGGRVTFDGLAPDANANDLIRFLAKEPRPRIEAERRPRVFFLPGLLGDDPNQASFRRALRRDVLFEVLETAGTETPSRVLADIPAHAARLVDTVVRSQPAGDIRLVGSSFGGLVAQEMARQLEARGRTVALLAVLDGFLAPPIWKSAHARWKAWLGRVTGPVLRRTNALGAVRRILSTRLLRDRPWTRVQHRRLLRAFGLWAVLGWRAAPCSAPTLLAASDEFNEFSSVEAWRRLCPRLRVVAVRGNHRQLLEPAAMALVIPAFLEALAESGVAVT